MSGKDRLFHMPEGGPGDFVFDEGVVRVLPGTINRSVRGYGQIVRLTGLLAKRYARDDSLLYDLGCTRCVDVMDCAIENASVVALNFTLQVVEPGSRHLLLRRIAESSRPGGGLLLSDKACFVSAEEQRLQAEWHHDFKRGQGYSELEIAWKRDALENVMKADSLPQHHQRLTEARFGRAYPWHQGFNFVSLIAFRQQS